MSNALVRGLVSILRLPYWLMTGGLSLLTAFALTRGPLNIETILLVFFSMAFITSAGFALNDYFDKESDAIIKPKRPIPSGQLSLKQVVVISLTFFAAGLILALRINLLSLAILGVDSALLVVYSAFIKRKSGFAANVLVGLLVGTAFIYGEATVFQTISLISLALYPICFGTMGGNVLRDVLSIEGDSRTGYPTLPQKIGNKNSVRVAAFFFILTAALAPLPAVLHIFGLPYLLPISLWSILLLYSSIRLVVSSPSADNVRKY
jgi:geranylgeranylglycerol-phosphate geranylgeranyltransferase